VCGPVAAGATAPGSGVAIPRHCAQLARFRDKAAPTCKGISTEPGAVVEMGRDEVVTSCRATFVITGIKRRS
jgi:hypothetical protein